MELLLQLDTEMITIFKEEANAILDELRLVVDKLEAHEGAFPKALLEEFANKTDRIMGTGDTFYKQYPEHEIFKKIGNFGALCKATGYKASTLNHLGLVPIFASFWADTLDTMGDLIENIDHPERLEEINRTSGKILHKRLTWLAQQIVEINKRQTGTEPPAMDVDGLLKKLGVIF
jgi:hypothetical protein